MPEKNKVSHRDLTTANAANNCGVPEQRFPELGKCCCLKAQKDSSEYEKCCSSCGIWSSLPDGESLSVSHIFECSLYGYGKRLKEK